MGNSWRIINEFAFYQLNFCGIVNKNVNHQFTKNILHGSIIHARAKEIHVLEKEERGGNINVSK